MLVSIRNEKPQSGLVCLYWTQHKRLSVLAKTTWLNYTNHKTGLVTGLSCDTINSGLGKVPGWKCSANRRYLVSWWFFDHPFSTHKMLSLSLSVWVTSGVLVVLSTCLPWTHWREKYTWRQFKQVTFFFLCLIYNHIF